MRTPHPDRVFWRTFRARRSALVALLGKLVATLLMALMIWGFTLSLADQIRRYGFSPDALTEGGTLPLAAALAPMALFAFLLLCAGCFTVLMYAHRGLLVALAPLLIPSALLVSLEPLIMWGWVSLERLLGLPKQQNTIPGDEVFALLRAFLVVGGVVALGVIPGATLRPVLARSKRKRVCRLRRRIRRRRQPTD